MGESDARDADRIIRPARSVKDSDFFILVEVTTISDAAFAAFAEFAAFAAFAPRDGGEGSLSCD